MSIIPPNAKKVFEGVLFDVYQWEQEMFDGSTATFEITALQASTEVIATVDKKIILLNQVQPNRKPYPSLPGGRIENDEEPLVAAQRELTEESGYTSEAFELLYSFTGNSKIYHPEFIYIARDCHNGLLQSLDTGEKITVTLVTFDEFLHTVRDPLFAASWGLKQAMLEALLDEEKYEEMKRTIFGG